MGTTNADEAIEITVLNCLEVTTNLNSQAKKIESLIYRLEKFLWIIHKNYYPYIIHYFV